MASNVEDWAEMLREVPEAGGSGSHLLQSPLDLGQIASDIELRVFDEVQPILDREHELVLGLRDLVGSLLIPFHPLVEGVHVEYDPVYQSRDLFDADAEMIVQLIDVFCQLVQFVPGSTDSAVMAVQPVDDFVHRGPPRVVMSDLLAAAGLPRLRCARPSCNPRMAPDPCSRAWEYRGVGSCV